MIPVETVSINEEECEQPVMEEVKGYETLKSEKNDQLDNRRLWVDVISDNRNPAKGRTMECIAPTIVNGKIEVEN